VGNGFTAPPIPLQYPQNQQVLTSMDTISMVFFTSRGDKIYSRWPLDSFSLVKFSGSQGPNSWPIYSNLKGLSEYMTRFCNFKNCILSELAPAGYRVPAPTAKIRVKFSGSQGPTIIRGRRVPRKPIHPHSPRRQVPMKNQTQRILNIQ